MLNADLLYVQGDGNEYPEYTFKTLGQFQY